MATRGTVRELRKAVAGMKKGETIWINAINCTEACIEALKKMIEDEVLTPDGKELNRCCNPAARAEYRIGRYICPQMTYIKL